jgi:signal transduction histidine kinase
VVATADFAAGCRPEVAQSCRRYSDIVLAIQDDGVGIATDDLPKVFDAFFSTRSAVATGIGLFIAKQFVEGHGGHIEIKSRNDAEHHGTAVTYFCLSILPMMFL